MQIAKNILICTAIAFICIFGLIMFQNVCVEVFIEWGWETRPDAEKEWAALFKYGFLWSFVFVGIVTAILEELVFRWCTCQALLRWTKLKEFWIIIITAIVFMLWHMSFSQAIYQFIMGVVFAKIYLKTRNIWWTTLIHFINNAFIVTYLYITGVQDEIFVLSFGNIALAVGLVAVSITAVAFLIKGLPNGKKG